VRTPTLLILVFALTLSVSSRAADNEEPRLRALLDRLPVVEKDYLAKARYAGHYTPSSLVGFYNHQGRLFAAFHLPPQLVKQFTDPAAPLLISLEGSPHLWAIQRRKSGTLDQGLSMITLTCYAPDQTWPFNRYSLSSDGQNLMLAAAQMFGHVAAQQTLSLSQSERTLHLEWRLEADRWQHKRIDLVELNQLPLRAPNLLERYLTPVLRQLGPARAAVDVYSVFDRLPADPKMTQQVLPLVARLDADEAKTRDAATAALKALGRPAVHACLRLDQSNLSPEQKNRLSAFYAAEGWIHVPDVEAARNDPQFIASCLEDEDQEVRTAAANSLAALRAVQPIR
jgi:HEAT repeat